MQTCVNMHEAENVQMCSQYFLICIHVSKQASYVYTSPCTLSEEQNVFKAFKTLKQERPVEVSARGHDL